MARHAGPIVDAHHHLWTFDADLHPWLADPARKPLARDFGPGDYRQAFAGFPLAATVWVEALSRDPEQEAALASDWHDAHPDLCNALVAHVPLDASDAGARLDRLQARFAGLRGVRDVVSWAPGRSSFARAPDLLTRPGFRRGLAELRGRQLSFDLMLLPHQLETAAAVLGEVEGLRVAVEHAASPEDQSRAGLDRWRRGLRRIASLPATIVKVSALHVLQPEWTNTSLKRVFDPLVEVFGPERLCFGSDYPTHDLACPGATALDSYMSLTSAWSAADQHAFFAGTAARFYRLSLPSAGRAGQGPASPRAA